MATDTNTEQEVQTPDDNIPTGDISESELAGLSDEERAALSDDSDETAEAEPDDQEEAAAEASDEGEKPKDGEEAEEEAHADEAPEADEEVSAKDEEPDEEAPKLPEQRKVADLNEFDGKIKEIEDALNELDTQVADGDIDLTDHIRQTRQLQDAKTQIMLEKANAQRNAEENQLEIGRQWDQAIDQFYSEPANKVFDAPDQGGNELAFETMRNWLMKLQEKQPGRAPSWYLNKAKADVSEMMGLATQQQQEPKKRRKSALDGANIPNTLSELPAAKNNTVQGEFSHLDKLSGEELEEAVARMTPDQMDRWARL